MKKVSLIVVHYLPENRKYLDLCMRSIKNLNTDGIEIETILMITNPKIPVDTVIYPGAKVVHTECRYHYPEAINLGTKHSDPEADYFMFLNDDTCLTKDSLRNMVMCADGENAIMNPISNCDNGAKYLLNMMAQEHQLVERFYRYKDIAGKEAALMGAHSMYPPGILMTEWVALYATLVPRSVWNRVGELDPAFKTGQDDVDYSIRCRHHGIYPVICLNALIWHFGGVTADIALDEETRNTNAEYFKKKWGIDPP